MKAFRNCRCQFHFPEHTAFVVRRDITTIWIARENLHHNHEKHSRMVSSCLAGTSSTPRSTVAFTQVVIQRPNRVILLLAVRACLAYGRDNAMSYGGADCAFPMSTKPPVFACSVRIQIGRPYTPTRHVRSSSIRLLLTVIHPVRLSARTTRGCCLYDAQQTAVNHAVSISQEPEVRRIQTPVEREKAQTS